MYGDFVLVNKLAPRFRDFDLGDIVVAKSMNHPDRHICKRILGMPGDTVCLGKERALRKFEI
ncbi:IMP1 inner mitochondrial membrane peptidase-like [Coelomomyces lativittatus]|nr:IMP1 inner mitochondrial membrane peptidase-like [Coelomomyces lativittatus]